MRTTMRWQDFWRTGWLDWRRKRFWAWVLLAVYTLLGFVIAPWLLRGVIVDAVHTQLGREARLDDVDLNPFVLGVRLEGFALADEDSSVLAAFDELYVNFQLSSLFRWAWTFAEVRLTNPSVRAVRDRTGALNLLALVPPAEPTPPTAETSVVRLVIAQIEIVKGRAAVIDRAARSPFTTELGPIDVTIRDVSTLPDDTGEQRVVIETESGGRVQWSGTLALHPLHSAGNATITGVPLAKLSAYLPADVALAITQGHSDVSFRYDVAESAEGVSANVHDFVLALNNLRLVATGSASGGSESRDLLSFVSLRVEGGELGWPQRTLAFSEVSLTTPDVNLWRDVDRRFVWELLAPPPPSASPPPPAEPADTSAADANPDRTDSSAVTPPTAEEQPNVAQEPPWNVTVARVVVNGGSVRFVDRALAPESTFAVTGIDGSLATLSLENDAEFPFKLDFDVDGGGSFVLDGLLTAFPVLRFTAQASLNGLSLPLAQPYVAELTHLDLESGTLDFAGALTSAAEETLTYEGTFAVHDLSVVDDSTRTPLVSWKKLALDGIAVQLDAAHAEIANVELDEPYGRIHIAKDGTLNVGSVIKPNDSPEAQAVAVGSPPDATESGEPWSLKVGRLRVAKGGTDYRDDNLPIPFAIAIHELGGELGALDTASRAPARLSLEGAVGEFGLARITGALQPLAITRNTTIDARFENIALPEASPYSIRFAGRRIASGKLDMAMRYRIENDRLEAEHDIVLRDFALGEKVDSPGALDLPFGLAIALLKGPDGNIDVELPIEGDIDDPEFRIGGVIVKALVNLLTKIATSPFRLLAGLVGVGDSEDFDQVTFAPGRSDLAPPEREKIAKLAEALVQRPQLELEVPGAVDRDADAAAIRGTQVNARVEAAVAGGDQAVRRDVLGDMFEASKPDEPLEGLIQRFTSVPDDGGKPVLDELAYLNEIVHQLIDAEPMAPAALDNLAAARSAAVRDGIQAGAAVEPARIGIAPPHDVKVNEDGVVAMTLGVGVGE